MWKGGFRVQDCAVSPDGRRLVAADTDSKIHVFDFRTYEEDYCLSVSSKPTSVAISRDSRHMLVNLAEGQIQLVDMETAAVVRRFRGQKQGEFVIRSTFGGAAENFVVSGSEGMLPMNMRYETPYTNQDRLTSLYLAQGQWSSRGDFGRSHRRVRKFNIMEPKRSTYVRLGR